ncbi:hypothetical protein VV089_24340 [Candidatus Merdisoma sp. JLR.KK011]|uniref:hypothetical protein n=1 Tax=Candidatus Merdisoma sp. JLR.KK011 TaxID=3114299 RepID=UPI002FF002F5
MREELPENAASAKPGAAFPGSLFNISAPFPAVPCPLWGSYENISKALLFVTILGPEV